MKRLPTGELDDYLESMIQQLKPREQVVLQLRFGLGGKQCHSLSQVSALLNVSKERIRQIQEGRDSEAEKPGQERGLLRGQRLSCSDRTDDVQCTADDSIAAGILHCQVAFTVD